MASARSEAPPSTAAAASAPRPPEHDLDTSITPFTFPSNPSTVTKCAGLLAVARAREAAAAAAAEGRTPSAASVARRLEAEFGVGVARTVEAKVAEVLRTRGDPVTLALEGQFALLEANQAMVAAVAAALSSVRPLNHLPLQPPPLAPSLYRPTGLLWRHF